MRLAISLILVVLTTAVVSMEDMEEHKETALHRLINIPLIYCSISSYWNYNNSIYFIFESMFIFNKFNCRIIRDAVRKRTSKPTKSKKKSTRPEKKRSINKSKKKKRPRRRERKSRPNTRPSSRRQRPGCRSAGRQGTANTTTYACLTIGLKYQQTFNGFIQSLIRVENRSKIDPK